MSTPDLDLATHIGTNVAALTLGTNLFMGPLRAKNVAIPDQVVFVLNTGGPQPSEFIEGGGTPELYEHSLQVRVRSAPGASSFEDGQALARTVRDAIHRASISGYIDVWVRSSSPDYIEVDDEDRHEWVIGVGMEIEE